jgi:hypothetical protein
MANLHDLWRRSSTLNTQPVQVIKRENVCTAWCSWLASFIRGIDWLGKRERQETPFI